MLNLLESDNFKLWRKWLGDCQWHLTNSCTDKTYECPQKALYEAKIKRVQATMAQLIEKNRE